ncbi:MAG: putative lipoprotein [Chthonomonadales bacterium]|nr:putative lipoprotein [Chthonomonadales bacterium]
MMNTYRFVMRRLMSSAALILGLTVCLASLPVPGHTQSRPNSVTQKAGKYGVDLRLPEQGLVAQEEADVEFHVSDLSQDDPVQGAPPIVKAKISARVTMPTMASMPAQSPKTHTEGVPGDYGVVVYFPHGGDYQLDLTITPLNDKAFTVSYKVPVGDARASNGKKPAPQPYTLEVHSDPPTPTAGRPTKLTIVVQSRETRQPVTEFDTVHERQIHFMVVSADLQHFAHEHPVIGSGGKFTLTYTFPTGGEYHLFADVAPKGAGSQILMQPLQVFGQRTSNGGNGFRFKPSLTDTVDGVQIHLTTEPTKFPIGRSLNITFTVKDAATGAAITDLEPYLGAMAHLMLIHEDGTTFVHSHPDETDPTNGHQGSLTFLARFPKPGFYRGWLQIQRAGVVETATFTWEVRSEKRS